MTPSTYRGGVFGASVADFGARSDRTWVREPIALGIIMVVAGIGNGAQFAASYPLLTRIVFPNRMGLYTGLNGSVSAITTPIAVLIAGGLITALGFKSLFPFVATMFLLALPPLAALRIERSHYQQSVRASALSGRPTV